MAVTAYIESEHGVSASVGNATPARLMRLAVEVLREAARVEGRALVERGPEDPQAYLADYLTTTADGLADEADLVDPPSGSRR